MICPDCNGEKKMIGMFPVYAEHVPQAQRKPFISLPCDRCRATGEVSDETPQWIADGKRLRAMRMKPYRNLCTEADSRGISVVELSRMESGKVKPIFPACEP